MQVGGEVILIYLAVTVIGCNSLFATVEPPSWSQWIASVSVEKNLCVRGFLPQALLLLVLTFCSSGDFFPGQLLCASSWVVFTTRIERLSYFVWLRCLGYGSRFGYSCNGVRLHFSSGFRKSFPPSHATDLLYHHTVPLLFWITIDLYGFLGLSDCGSACRTSLFQTQSLAESQLECRQFGYS